MRRFTSRQEVNGRLRNSHTRFATQCNVFAKQRKRDKVHVYTWYHHHHHHHRRRRRRLSSWAAWVLLLWICVAPSSTQHDASAFLRTPLTNLWCPLPYGRQSRRHLRQYARVFFCDCPASCCLAGGGPFCWMNGPKHTQHTTELYMQIFSHKPSAKVSALKPLCWRMFRGWALENINIHTIIKIASVHYVLVCCFFLRPAAQFVLVKNPPGWWPKTESMPKHISWMRQKHRKRSDSDDQTHKRNRGSHCASRYNHKVLISYHLHTLMHVIYRACLINNEPFPFSAARWMTAFFHSSLATAGRHRPISICPTICQTMCVCATIY